MKTVLITGASSGIGRATAKQYALSPSEYRIIITGRRMDLLQKLKHELSPCDCHILNFDVREYSACDFALQSLSAPFDKIDVLINNAGLALGLDYINDGDINHWNTMIDTNIKGLLYMTRLVSNKMIPHQSGHIVNICSTAGKDVYPKGNVYCATKFAVDALTKSLRQDLVQHNIRVSQVAPGHVEETEFAITRFEGDTERAAIYKDFNPLTSRDIAETIYFITTRPAHVNIQDILMTGTQQASATLVNRSGRLFDEK